MLKGPYMNEDHNPEGIPPPVSVYGCGGLGGPPLGDPTLNRLIRS